MSAYMYNVFVCVCCFINALLLSLLHNPIAYLFFYTDTQQKILKKNKEKTKKAYKSFD